ncbi:dTDP-4-dehydro-6-deoxyglucose reductase [Acrasis kona]|uniref:dTDP-4-dehydro-6-deoxyglucose reductase n=1 Tax=Acrasis kona TaxID=1008807 RepID=A0AAW2YWY4_9EUKA
MGQQCCAYIHNRSSFDIQLYDHTTEFGKLKFLNEAVIPHNGEHPLPLFEPEPSPDNIPSNSEYWYSGTFRYTLTNPRDTRASRRSYAFEIVCKPHSKTGAHTILRLTPRYDSHFNLDFPFVFVEPIPLEHPSSPVNVFEIQDILQVADSTESIVLEGEQMTTDSDTLTDKSAQVFGVEATVDHTKSVIINERTVSLDVLDLDDM